MAAGHVLRCVGHGAGMCFGGSWAQTVPQIPVAVGSGCRAGMRELWVRGAWFSKQGLQEQWGFPGVGPGCPSATGAPGPVLPPFLHASGLSAAGGWAALSASSGAAAHAVAEPEGCGGVTAIPAVCTDRGGRLWGEGRAPRGVRAWIRPYPLTAPKGRRSSKSPPVPPIVPIVPPVPPVPPPRVPRAPSGGASPRAGAARELRVLRGTAAGVRVGTSLPAAPSRRSPRSPAPPRG